MNTQEILDSIYGGGLNNKDMAVIIRKIFQALDDSFYENPPSVGQLLTLKALLTLADEVEEFFK